MRESIIRRAIPRDAELLCVLKPTPAQRKQTPVSRLEVWLGMLSRGYKTGYERRPHAWVLELFDDGEWRVFRYSGRNLKKLLKQLETLRIKGRGKIKVVLGGSWDAIMRRYAEWLQRVS